MGLIVVSMVVNGLVMFSTLDSMPGLIWLFGPALGLQALGAILVLAGSRKPGAYCVIAGAIAFVPIGLIGAFGARKVLDQLSKEQFEADRNRA